MILALHIAHQATNTTNICIFFNMDVFLVNSEYNMALHVSDTRGASFVKAVHTTVSKEALEWDTESLCTLIPILMTCSDETTHVHETVLL